jgi:hypothetical protein
VKLVKRGPDGAGDGLEVCKYSWMVGTDGAKGVVRKQLGLKFVGETRAVENFVVGDIYEESLSSEVREKPVIESCPGSLTRELKVLAYVGRCVQCTVRPCPL